jgi:ferric-dicitrate binding protein FerR (iron transport regulator)
MQRDDLRAVRDAMDPPWDDLRAQRVLRAARTGRASRRVVRRRMWAGGACLAAAAVVAAVFVVRMPARSTVAPAAVSSASVAPAGSVMELMDGSRLAIGPSADVQVELQAPGAVKLVQRAGEVHYDVTPNPARSFEVRAATVRVRVVGTAFGIHMDKDSVHVTVQRGRVAVDDATGTTELGAGEELKRSLKLESAALAPSEPEAASSIVAPRASAEAVASVEDLLRRADQARASGRLDEAAMLLQQILVLHPKDKRAGAVLFTLGKVERARGNPAVAAAHFRACSRGPLAEDALAEEASAWMAAGQTGNAADAARRYLQRFPDGPHVARMRRMVE